MDIRYRWIDGPGGRLRLMILSPGSGANRPGVLWIHGGGYCTGMPEMALLSRAADLVKHGGAVVVAPAYRLAPKHPWPAGLRDAQAALRWMLAQAEELGLRRDQIMVGGESAGGGMTAALCMLERDCGGVKIAFQMPLYPMLDDRDTPSSRDNHAPVWNTARNHRAWAAYLRGTERDALSPYAAPARQTDYRGLPPCYTFVGDAEPFYEETKTFVSDLRAAGVAAEMDVYPGQFHSFDLFLPFSRDGRRASALFLQRFRAACENYFADNGGKKDE